MDDLRCITLHQPYASLVARRLKRFETRSWKTSYRGPLAIHAGQRRPFNLTRQAEPPRIGTWTIDWGLHPDLSGATNGGFDEGTGFVLVEREDDATGPEDCLDYIPLHLGAVVAVAEVTDCLPIVNAHIPHDPPAIEATNDGGLHLWQAHGQTQDITNQRPYGHWTPGSWAWRLDDMRPLAEPIPAKGKERLWRPDDDLTARIAAPSGTGGTA